MLKDVHDKLEEIPENYRDLYTERSGKWELTGIQGVQTSANVSRLEEAARKEREDHKKTKELLAKWDGMDKEEMMTKLDRFEEFKLAAEGKLDDEKIDEMVEKRIGSKIAPVQRQVDDLTKANGILSGENVEFKSKDNRRTIEDAVRKVNSESKAKVLDSAMDDMLMNAHAVLEITEDGRIVTKDKVGVTPGIDVAGWVQEISPNKQHWWPNSGGGGAVGDGGQGGGIVDNPFTAENWNKTKQAQYYREHGSDKADRAAKLAGTKVGGPKPQKKTA